MLNNMLNDKWSDKLCPKLKTLAAYLVAVMALAVVPLSSVQAIELQVDNLTNENDTNCFDGDCSLREAIEFANVDALEDTIILPEGTINLLETQITITNDVVIEGAGPGLTRINGSALFNEDGSLNTAAPSRLFTINSGVSFTATGVTFDGPPADYAATTGGCISTDPGAGPLTLENVSFENCVATNSGGAIFADEAVNVDINSSEFKENSSSSGSVIFALANNDISIKKSSLSNNTGSALALLGSSQATINNTTFSENEISLAVELASTAILDHVTIADDTGIKSISNEGKVTTKNSIFASNNNCLNPLITKGNNLDVGNSCGLDPSLEDLSDTDPLLEAFVTEGGYYPLGENSPAIDAGKETAGILAPLSEDQLGNLRIVDGNNDGVIASDMGAIEFQPEGGDSSGSGSGGGSGGGCSLALAGSASSGVAWMGLALLSLLGFRRVRK